MMTLQILSVSILVFAAMLSLLVRQGLLRLLVGVNLLSLSAAIPFLVFGSKHQQAGNSGEPFAVLALLGGTITVSLGLALATRLFYLKGRAELMDIRELKN